MVTDRLPVPVAEGREPLELLRDAVSALAAEGCESHSPVVLRMHIKELRRLMDLLEAEFVR